MTRTRRQSARGFTLLELLVVSILSIALAMMTAQLWRTFSVQAADLTSRTTAAQELRLAMESLSDDMGSVIWACRTGSGGLLVCRASADHQSYDVIEYEHVGGQLVRSSSLTAASLPIADHVAAFAVTEVSSTILQLHIDVTDRNVTRSATLFWSPPA